MSDDAAEDDARDRQAVRGFDRTDAAEALVGSVVVGIPMAVEGGTLEVGAFIATRPVALVGTVVFGIALLVGLIYVADIRDVRIVSPLFGVIPRRLVGVVGIAATTALVMMTGWGRVDWATPAVALAQVAVAFVPMAIGASLVDLLPEDE